MKIVSQICHQRYLALCAAAALVSGGLSTQAQPTTAPASPTRAASLVSAIYNSSGTYTDIAGINYYENWGGWSSAGDYSIPPVVLGYQGVNYGGIDLNAPYNFTSYNFLHVDVYTPNGSSFAVRLVSSSGQADVTYTTAGGVITPNTWVHLDIPLTQFTGLDLSSIHQLGLINNNPGETPPADFYLDNVYFYTTNSVVTPPAINYPTNNAPTPTNAPARVLSLYNSSGVYANAANINFYPWGSAISAAPYTITNGGTVNSYLGLSYYGVEMDPDYNGGADVNASAFNTLHVDVWTTANQLAIKLVSTINGAAPELIYTASSGVITSNHWVSLNIPLSAFTSLNPNLDLAHLDQLLWIDNGDIPGSGVQFGNFYIDNVYFFSNSVVGPVVINYPTNNAPTPTHAPANVQAIYDSSGTYTATPADEFPASWSGSPQNYYTITNTGSVVLNCPGLSFVGNTYYSNPINLTGKTTMHIDLWTATGNQFYIQLVSISPTQPAQVGLFNMGTNQWVGLDIPLSQFASANPSTVLANIQQILWVDNVGSGVLGANFYIDNVYFYTAATPTRPTITTSLSAGSLRLSFPTQSGFNYTVQYKTNLTDSTWLNLGVAVVGNGSAQTVTDPTNGSARRFYRLSVQ